MQKKKKNLQSTRTHLQCLTQIQGNSLISVRDDLQIKMGILVNLLRKSFAFTKEKRKNCNASLELGFAYISLFSGITGENYSFLSSFVGLKGVSFPLHKQLHLICSENYNVL